MTTLRRAARPGFGAAGQERVEGVLLSARVAADLARQELDPPEQPKRASAEISEDISDAEDRTLIGMMVNQTAWADYAAGQLAVAEIDLEEIESAMRQMREQHLVTTYDDHAAEDAPESKKKGVTVRKAELFGQETYKTLESGRLNAYARRRLLLARFESFSRREAVLSRELTRRTGRDGPQRRSAGLGR